MTHRLFALFALFFLVCTTAHAQRNTLSFPNRSGRTGQELVVPLQGNFTDPVTGIVATVLFDPDVVGIADVSLGSVASDFTLVTNLSGGQLRVALAGAEPISGAGTVLNLTIRLVGPPGSASVLDIALAVLNEGDRLVSRSNGLITVVREVRVIGAAFYRNGLQPISEAVVSANDQTTGAVQRATTDATGTYIVGPMPVGNYRITITKENSIRQGITPLDASEILRHVVGLAELSQDQRQSADVSGNGTVGTSDASLILRYLVGLEDTFPAGPFWQFQPEALILSLMEDHFQRFTAMLLGDVNGDWQPPAGKPVAAIPARLRLLEPVLQESGVIRFALSGEELDDVRAGTLHLRYDPRALEIRQVRATGLAADFLTAVNLEQPGQISVAFAGISPVAGHGELFLLDFDERGLQGTTTAVEIAAASLDESPLPSASLESRTFVLGGGSTGQPASPGLEPNYPNPFNSATTLRYRIAAPATVHLEIFAASGQKVRSLVAGHQPVGTHSISWDGTDDLGVPVSTGVYLARLRTGDFVESRRLMLLK